MARRLMLHKASVSAASGLRQALYGVQCRGGGAGGAWAPARAPHHPARGAEASWDDVEALRRPRAPFWRF